MCFVSWTKRGLCVCAAGSSACARVTLSGPQHLSADLKEVQGALRTCTLSSDSSCPSWSSRECCCCDCVGACVGESAIGESKGPRGRDWPRALGPRAGGPGQAPCRPQLRRCYFPPGLRSPAGRAASTPPRDIRSL